VPSVQCIAAGVRTGAGETSELLHESKSELLFVGQQRFELDTPTGQHSRRNVTTHQRLTNEWGRVGLANTACMNDLVIKLIPFTESLLRQTHQGLVAEDVAGLLYNTKVF